MALSDNILFCDGCGVEIVGAPPVVTDKQYYCCQDCADGRECNCGYIVDEGEDFRSGKSGPQGNGIIAGIT